MKKILILNYEFPPLGGGGGVNAKRLAEGFIALGYQVDYVTTWFEGLKESEIVNDIHVHRVKVVGRKELPTATMISLVSFPFLAYKKVDELCKQNKYEFINTHFAVPTGPLGVWISKKFGIKNILSLHGGDVYDPTKERSPHKKWYFRAVVNWVLRQSTVLVAQSSNTKKNIELYYEPGKEIQIIPIPYRFHEYKKVSRKELGLKDDVFYTISVGRLVARKGLDFLLKSLSSIQDDGIESLIIGDGPEKEHLQKMVQELGLTHRVHFLNAVNDERKFQYLAVSDVFILSSVHEGFGIVLQEAIQAGLPIIATDNGGQVDVVTPDAGFLIAYGDESALAEKISFYAAQPSPQKVNGAELLKRFSLEDIAKRYISLVSV